MKLLINILNKDISYTRDVILETEDIIQREERRKESAKKEEKNALKRNIDSLRSLKKPMGIIIINYLMLNIQF